MWLGIPEEQHKLKKRYFDELYSVHLFVNLFINKQLFDDSYVRVTLLRLQPSSIEQEYSALLRSDMLPRSRGNARCTIKMVKIGQKLEVTALFSWKQYM